MTAVVLLLAASQCSESDIPPGERGSADAAFDAGGGGDGAGGGGDDAGPQDGGAGEDAGLDAGRDAGVEDGGAADAGTGAGPEDGGAQDAGDRGGLRDAGPGDAGAQDAGPQDAGRRDAGAPDAGPDDAGLEDAGADAGPAPDAGADGGVTGLEPDPAFLPAATGSCPMLVDGTLTFAPAGIEPRDVRIWIDDAADRLDGPLVFYWHGTGSSPTEALFGLGQQVIDEITALGGIVAAPTADPAAGFFPWFLTTTPSGGRDDDILVADEVLACALQDVGVDLRHVHSLGMSAGGLQTAQMSYRRSGYLASVVTYSGGLASTFGLPPFEDPSNAFAALIFHGGASDVVFIDFEQASERYWQDLVDAGHFAAICNHGGGHTIPTDARDSVWRFFQDHPFGEDPSPYAGGLPLGFPAYCGLSPSAIP